MVKEGEDITIKDKESFDALNDELLNKSDNFLKLGFSKIQGSSQITLEQECNRLKEEAKKPKGTICSCCGSKVKLYKRTITYEMAICILYMLKFYRHSEKAVDFQYYTKEDFFEELIYSNNEYVLGNFTKLKYWDIIAPMPIGKKVNGKIVHKKGYFALTENGVKFAQREIGLPKYAYVYKDQVNNHSTNDFFYSIDDILTSEIYESIMYDKNV